MNWLNFLLWVGGAYLIYYLVIILVDVFATKRAVIAGAASNELTFSDDLTPVKLAADIGENQADVVQKPLAKATTPTESGSEIIGSGGVVIDNLFKLCKLEAVTYIRSVSF